MRYHLSLDQIPTRVVQRAAGDAGAAAAAAAPGHQRAGRSRRPRAAVPDGPHRAGGVGRAVDRRTGRGARHPAPVAADAVGARRTARARARHAGAHLLQGRVGVARGLAQAQHRGAAGLLQQGRRRQRASRPRPARASGGPRWRSRARSSTSSAWSTWCGRRTSRSRTARSSWRRGARRWCRRPSTSPIIPARSGSRSATRCATRRRATTRTTRSARCSTTCCCTRP